jgi:drug/metabolite transporter (DMT)-like permease
MRDYMAGREKTVAILSLLTGATIWGMVWYPYRVLEQSGMSGLHASVLSYLVALLVGVVMLRGALRHAWQAGGYSWKLLLIALAGGGCNLGYVLAVLHGEVMRVLLLFYLAPLWTVLWARLLLGERLSRVGMGVVALSLAGAITMLWQPELDMPWPTRGAEWLGLAAGFLFALSNVMVRQSVELSIELKSLSVFFGVVLLGGLVMGFQAISGTLPPLPVGMMTQWGMLGLLVLIGLILMVTNLVVQHGLTQTPANQAIVIFLFELVVAALSSWWLAGETMTLREWLGGAMIVAASLFSGHLAVEHEASV